MIIKNQNGNSIVEVLVASVILLTAFLGMLSYVVGLKNSTQKMLTSRSRMVQIQKVVDLILSDPKLFKVNFDITEAATCAALENSSLPMAWDDKGIYEISDCPGCRGRMGYVIQPFPLQSARGVYMVTIRVTHPTLTMGKVANCNSAVIENTEQMQMIVSLR